MTGDATAVPEQPLLPATGRRRRRAPTAEAPLPRIKPDGHWRRVWTAQERISRRDRFALAALDALGRDNIGRWQDLDALADAVVALGDALLARLEQP